jgi:hypothetical protein
LRAREGTVIVNYRHSIDNYTILRRLLKDEMRQFIYIQNLKDQLTQIDKEIYDSTRTLQEKRATVSKELGKVIKSYTT